MNNNEFLISINTQTDKNPRLLSDLSRFTVPGE